MRNKVFFRIAALAICLVCGVGGLASRENAGRIRARASQSPASTAQPTSSVQPTATPQPTVSATPTPTAIPTPTAKPTATAKPAATAKSTAKPASNSTSTSAKAKTGPFSDEMKIPYPSGVTLGAAAAAQRKYDVANSAYYKQLDIYNMKNTKTRTIITKFKTYQQTMEWTSGPASMLMVLNYYGKLGTLTEMGIANLRGGTGESVTTLTEMIHIVQNIGGLKYASTFNSTDVDTVTLDVIYAYIDRGVPVMVEWMDWDGHWQVVIGYDNMGTSSVTDDVLFVADSYDTTDHCQDGYCVVPAERFLFMWKDTANLPESENQKVLLAIWPE